MGKLQIVMLGLLVMVSGIATAQQEWSLAKDKDGIKVYTRKYGNYNYKEYKGIAVINGSVQDVVKILKDVAKYDQWAYNCVANSASILKKNEAKGEYYIYMEIKAPLVSNRDVISLYKFHPPAADGSVLVEFTGQPAFIPKKNGLVRIPDVSGTWKLIPMAGGKVKIVHQAFSHPGGSPPAGLVNSSIVNAPYYMLAQIRQMISG